MLMPGLNRLGSSRVDGFMPITSGIASNSENNGVPQVAQKPRLMVLPLSAVTSKYRGSPLTIFTVAFGTPNTEAIAVPLERWQSRQ